MKILRKILSSLLVLCMSVSVFVPYTAVAADTVVIDTASELLSAAYAPDKNYVLGADIVLTSEQFQPGGQFYLSGKGFSPIGNESTPFSGTFDGNGYVIKGIKINHPTEKYVGLFGYVTGTVKNVALIDADIAGGYYTGGVAGYIGSGGTVTQCYTSNGTVSTRYDAANVRLGGLVGCVATNGKLSNSYNTANVFVNNGRSAYAAGVVGESSGGRVNYCYNAAVFDENTKYGIMAMGEAMYASYSYTIGANEFCTYRDNLYTRPNYWKTDAEFKTQSSMKNFDFTNVWTYDASTGYSYPVLRATPHKMTAKSSGSFSSGTGTAYDPYIIKTAAEFALIENDTDACYRLAADISLTSSYSSIPTFKGILYGDNKTITTVSPLFTENEGRIENVVINASINKNANVGAIAVKNSNTIADSKVSGAVAGTNAGGFCYENIGRILGSTSSANISATSGSAGGFAVKNTGLIGYDCSNEGTVTGKTVAGGIAASSTGKGNIKNAVNYGTVTGSTNVGGIAGELAGEVYSCANYGDITAKGIGANVGGIAGDGSYQAKCTICQNTGKITATGKDAAAGGILGQNRGIIHNLLNTGIVEGEGYAGGIAGVNDVSDNTSYGDISYALSYGKAVSANGTAAAIVGINKSTAQIYCAGYLPTSQKGYTGSATKVSYVTSLTREQFANPDQYMQAFDFSTTWELKGDLPTLKAFPYKAIESIALDKTAASTVKGKTVTVTAKAEPRDATIPNIEWSSSNPAVALVDENGVVTAKSEGSAVITAKADNKSATLKFNTVKLERLSGQDRLATAVAISDKGWTSAKTVVLANSMNYADALAGVPYAAKLDAPILLTGGKALESNIREQIKKLGATNIVILGGPGVISEEIEKDLGKKMKVERLCGKDRYETSLEIAKKFDSTDNVIIATGANYADALSISPYASLKEYPILYCNPSTGLTSDIAAVVKEADGVTVIGGPGMMPDSYFPNKFERVAGYNRYLTSYEIAKRYASEFGSDITIATGTNFPDALAGGVLCAKFKTPLLLTDSKTLISEIQTFIKSRNPKNIYMLGGPVIVPEEIIVDVF